MSEYIVQVRDTGEVVYSYTADVATDFPEYPFAQYNHVLKKIEAYTPPKRRVSKLELVALLGDDYIPILAASKSSVEVEAFVKMIDWATPEQDGTCIDLDDQRLTSGLARLEESGLLAAGRAAEIVA